MSYFKAQLDRQWHQCDAPNTYILYDEDAVFNYLICFHCRLVYLFHYGFIKEGEFRKTVPYCMEKQKATCPCGSSDVSIMYHRNGPRFGPGMVVCWICKRIAEINSGEVLEEKPASEIKGFEL